MFLPWLVTIPLLGGAPEATRFHPPESDLYVEVGDVPALMQAYAKVPAARFLDDPDVQKLGALTQQIGLDLGPLVRAAIPRLPGSAPDERLYASGDLQSLSFSIAGFDRAPAAPEAFAERAGIVVVCEFASEAGAQAMAPALEAAGWLAPRPAAPVTQPATQPEAPAASATITIDGGSGAVRLHHLSALGLEIDAWSACIGTRWILGAGRATPEAITARAAGKLPSLPAREVLFAGEKSFSASSGITVARAYADMLGTPFVAPGDEASPTALLLASLLPFAGARGVWRIELHGERFVTEGAYERIAPPTGITALIATKPVSPASAAYVPKAAVGAWLVPIQPRQLPAVLATWIAAPAAGAEAKPSAGAKTGPAGERAEQLGAALERALGSNAAVSLLPFSSIQSLVPQVVITLELRERETFLAAWRDLCAQLKEQRPDLGIEERPYRKVPITVFTPAKAAASAMPPPASAIPMLGALTSGDDATPSVAVLEDRVLLALKPTHLRTEIQRLEKLAAPGAAAEAHAIAAEGRIPAEALEASTIDWAGLFGKLYDTVRAFAPMLAQGQPLPFDPATLPSSSGFTKFFQPSFSWTKKTEHGLYTRSESSFGPETPLTLVALFAGLSRTQGATATPSNLLAGAFGGARTGGATQPGASAPPVQPAASKPVRDDAREKTLGTLRAVKTGIAVYRSQTGKPPDTLARLLVGTETFPKGFLDSTELPKDSWGHELRYVIEAQGGKYKLWSMGPDGVDQQAGGDDVALP